MPAPAGPRTVRLTPVQLRAAARTLRKLTGLHVELAVPAPTPVPPRRGKHVATVRLLRCTLAPRLPRGRVAVEGVSVERPGTDAHPAHLTPDLTVCPAGFLRSDAHLLHPNDVELAVEVLVPPVTADDLTRAVTTYATTGVPALLILDPRPHHATWTLHTGPVSGAYAHTQQGPYGNPVWLPALDLSLNTGQLPVYGERGR